SRPLYTVIALPVLLLSVSRPMMRLKAYSLPTTPITSFMRVTLLFSMIPVTFHPLDLQGAFSTIFPVGNELPSLHRRRLLRVAYLTRMGDRRPQGTICVLA